MLGGTICMIDRKAIFYRILSYRIIAGIIDFFIYDRLDGRVLGGVGIKTAEYTGCLPGFQYSLISSLRLLSPCSISSSVK